MLSTTFNAWSDEFDVENFAKKHDIDSEEYWVKGTAEYRDGRQIGKESRLESRFESPGPACCGSVIRKR